MYTVYIEDTLNLLYQNIHHFKVVSVAKFIISNLEDAVRDDKVGFINSLLNTVAPERSPETEPLRKSRRLIKDSSSR